MKISCRTDGFMKFGRDINVQVIAAAPDACASDQLLRGQLSHQACNHSLLRCHDQNTACQRAVRAGCVEFQTSKSLKAKRHHQLPAYRVRPCFETSRIEDLNDPQASEQV